MTELIESIMESKNQGLLSLTASAVVLLLSTLTLQIINYEVKKDFKNPAEWDKNLIAMCGANAVKVGYQ